MANVKALDRVRVEVLPIVKAFGASSVLREAIVAFCPPPARETRLLGRPMTIDNDLNMVLEEPAAFPRASVGVVWEGARIVGWGLAYGTYLSIYVAPERRRLGYGLLLAQTMRRRVGDVLLGSSPEGAVLQRKLDQEEGFFRRVGLWLWRRRPVIEAFWYWPNWTFGIIVPWRWRFELVLGPVRVICAVFTRQGAKSPGSCDHGVSLCRPCEKCQQLKVEG